MATTRSLSKPAGTEASTWWPRSSSSSTAPDTAATHSGSVAATPAGSSLSQPMRSAPGSAPTSSAYGRAGGGAA